MCGESGLVPTEPERRPACHGRIDFENRCRCLHDSRGTCPWRRRCRPCGSRSPTRCRTRPGRVSRVPCMTLVWGSGNGRGSRVVVEIHRHVRRGGDVENALQAAVGGGVDGGVDFFLGHGLLDDELDVDQRHVRGRHADRHAVELALEFRNDQADRPWRRRSRSGSGSGPRRGRDRGPCAGCRGSAGRRYRSGSWSSCHARCQSVRLTTSTTGARQLVVHEAFETTMWSLFSIWWLTP